MVRALAENGAAVSPNNSTDLAHDSVIYCGSGGDIKVDTVNGDTLTFVGVVGGSTLPVKVRRVYTTGTDASNMIACW